MWAILGAIDLGLGPLGILLAWLVVGMVYAAVKDWLERRMK
jgi:hypothetical protein